MPEEQYLKGLFFASLEVGQQTQLLQLGSGQVLSLVHEEQRSRSLTETLHQQVGQLQAQVVLVQPFKGQGEVVVDRLQHGLHCLHVCIGDENRGKLLGQGFQQQVADQRFFPCRARQATRQLRSSRPRST